MHGWMHGCSLTWGEQRGHAWFQITVISSTLLLMSEKNNCSFYLFDSLFFIVITGAKPGLSRQGSSAELPVPAEEEEEARPSIPDTQQEQGRDSQALEPLDSPAPHRYHLPVPWVSWAEKSGHQSSPSSPLSLYRAGRSGLRAPRWAQSWQNVAKMQLVFLKCTQTLFQSLCLAKLQCLSIFGNGVREDRGSALQTQVPCCRMSIHPGRIFSPATPS